MKVSASLQKTLILILFLSLAPLAVGKDLSARSGIGFSNVGFGQDAPTLSVDWQVTRASSFEFDLGMNTSSSNNMLLLGTRYFRNLYIEESQFFSLFLGAGLLTQQVSGVNNTGFFVELGAAARFFIAGLPNLGFSFGSGFKLTTTGGVNFKTMMFVGSHYYF